MGWQLIPTGIGWRSFHRTIDAGAFQCPNARCAPATDGTQPFIVRSGRNWITVLFIPLVPLNSTGVHVKCKRCKTLLPLSVLDDIDRGTALHAPEREAEVAPSGVEVVYTVGDWTPQQRESLYAELARLKIPYEWEPDTVAVDKSWEMDMDRIIVEIDGDAPAVTDAQHTDDLDAATVALPQRFDGVLSAAATRWQVVVPWGGAVSASPGTRIVVGRSPDVSGPEESVPLVVPPSWMDVSKTHFTVRFDAQGAFVEDENSVNGTRIREASGAELDVPAGGAVRVEPGAEVWFGEHCVRLERAGVPG